MTKNLNTKSIIAALLLVSSSAFAQTTGGNTGNMSAQRGMESARQTNNDGYLIDASGRVVKNSFGECWHTGSYNPSTSYNAECDGVVVAQAETPRAPEPRPQPPAEAQGGYAVQAVAETVYFNFDSAQITRATAQTLTGIAQRLKDNPNSAYTLNIVGHTDPVGTDAYNMTLSKKRAEAVRVALERLGVGVPIDVAYKGERELVVQCEKGVDYRTMRERNECNQPNRRAEVKINTR